MPAHSGTETNMTNRTRIGVAALALGLIAAVWLAVSPRMALSSLRDAAARKDAAALSAAIDYDALRANLREQVSAMMAREMSRGKGPAPIDPAAARAAMAFAGPMIDNMIQPATVTAMLSNPKGPLGAGLGEGDVEYTRLGLDRFMVGPKGSDGGVEFRLEGFSWRIVGIRPGARRG
jgi:hypothetical protein